MRKRIIEDAGIVRMVYREILFGLLVTRKGFLPPFRECFAEKVINGFFHRERRLVISERRFGESSIFFPKGGSMGLVGPRVFAADADRRVEKDSRRGGNVLLCLFDGSRHRVHGISVLDVNHVPFLGEEAQTDVLGIAIARRPIEGGAVQVDEEDEIGKP